MAYTGRVPSNRAILPWLAACAALSLAAPDAAVAAKKWREYTGCRVIPNASNDGDSFHVKPTNIKTRSYLFRLYFVDTPESESSLPERLQVQADYFGVPESKDILKIGKEAVKFTENFLADGNFTVYSRLSDALGRSDMDRDYAMVLNAAGQDLGTELVRNGLARVYGQGSDLGDLEPYKRDENAWWRRLRQVELEAKKEKRGAWALAGGPPNPLAALTAPRQVAEQDVVLARPIYLYPLDPANALPLGTLKAGLTVHVVKGATPDKAHVRFTSSSGQVYEGLARYVDLGL